MQTTSMRHAATNRPATMTKRPDAYVEHLSDDAWPDSALQEAARIQRVMSAHKRPRATDEREAVARAICAADFERGDGSPEDVAWQRAVDYNETFNYFNYADAALSALAPIRAAEILAAINRDTPAMAWLRTAVTPERRAQWATEDKAIADADRKTNGSK